jgi:XTP/dITP diphosphohydrolase
LKARHAAKLGGCAAVADDSGIEVDALGGAPGVYSARYAGSGANDDANNAKLLSALAEVPPAARQARYRCALVFVAAAGAPPLAAEAAWEGLVVDEPRGNGGFGYDPYFWLPELGKTAAELAPDEKNRWSHRGKAMRALRDILAGPQGAGA